MPALIGAGLTAALAGAQAAGGFLSASAADDARKDAEGKRRRLERQLRGLERERLKDEREVLGEQAALQARALENELVNRGVSRSTIAMEARERFNRALRRRLEAQNRAELALELGAQPGQIQRELNSELARAQRSGAFLREGVGLGVGLLGLEASTTETEDGGTRGVTVAESIVNFVPKVFTGLFGGGSQAGTVQAINEASTFSYGS